MKGSSIVLDVTKSSNPVTSTKKLKEQKGFFGGSTSNKSRVVLTHFSFFLLENDWCMCVLIIY